MIKRKGVKVENALLNNQDMVDLLLLLQEWVVEKRLSLKEDTNILKVIAFCSKR